MQVLHKRTETAFGSWLYDRYKESGLTTACIATAIGISRECFLYHVRGDNYPTVSSLFLYARYFSEDIYALIDLICTDLTNSIHRRNESAIYYMQKNLQSPFAQWLTTKIFINKLSIDDVADRVCLQPRTIIRHMASYSKPSFGVINRYADVFGENVWGVYELTLKNS